MPVIPPSAPSLPYPTADGVLNLARARLNDTILSAAGNLLSDSQNYTLTLLNGAFQHLQEDLANAGAAALTKEVVLPSLPIVSSNDPATQVWMNWQYFFDGNNYFYQPVLPPDLILPVRLWERQSGTQNWFTPMDIANDGLPSAQKTNYLGVWEWRQDAIYMIGSLIARDMRMRYAAYLPAIASLGTTQIPLMRCEDALANYVCADFSYSRGSADANAVGNSFLGLGQASMKRIMNREARQQQRGNHRRRGYSQGRHCGWGNF